MSDSTLTSNEQSRHVIIQRPGKVPELKGPWPPELLESSVRELYQHYPDVQVIVMSGKLPADCFPQHGQEFLDVLDGARCLCEVDEPRNPKCPVDHSRHSHETRVDPAAVLKWAVDSFGSIALNRDERAARMTEEAIEVAQVEGVTLEVIQRIAARVYSRPVGELGQEIGGLMVGLYALAANSGVDPDAEFRREFDRVLSKTREHWARKHAEKVAAGTADLTPQKAGDRREYHANGTYWSGVPTVDMPCDFCHLAITAHDPRTHACPSQGKGV